MLKSKIESENGFPYLSIDEKRTAAMAYATYFDERNRYHDFVKAGYRIFFVNLYFTKRPFNSSYTGFSAATVGVFDKENCEDYSFFDKSVEEILSICPDAVIFPRIYISMPSWWTETHENDVVPTNKGGIREALFSENFRKDAASLLSKVVKHIKQTRYSSRIAGWQICGGQTQEWFHFDLNGSLGDAAREPFAKWVKEKYGEDNAVLPSSEDYFCDGKNVYNENENARRYSLFCNEGVATTIEYFAKAIKSETNGEQIVGAFYGYTFENGNTVLYGSHALRLLIDSLYIDFFSSPNAYALNRAFGIDWADMIPVDSVKLHGKLCFIECDIRTYLTCGVQEARPGVYPEDIYRLDNGKSVWSGPETPALSREAIRKSFSHQLTKGSGLWWFDMWGGWYDDKLLMADIRNMKKLYDDHKSSNMVMLKSEICFFADETSYANMKNEAPCLSGIIKTRTNMGNISSPYDICMVEDVKEVIDRYKVAIFPFPFPSESGKRAIELCEKNNIPYLLATAEHDTLTVDEIRRFLRDNGVHMYTKSSDVVYAGNGYVALHCAVGGKKTLTLPFECYAVSVFESDVKAEFTREISFELSDNATALFALFKGELSRMRHCFNGQSLNSKR